MTTTTKLEFLPGNTISVLHDGTETYPVMLRAIHNAKKTIYFANYCYRKGKASDLFYQPLLNAARRGVKIHILIDAHGSDDFDQNQFKKMQLDHIHITRFNPRQTFHPLKFNKRLHKKLLVIDNEIGFTGGIGVGDFWLGDARYPKAWRDTHFSLEGPIVDAMTKSFKASWNRYSKEQLPPKEAASTDAVGSIPMALIDAAPLEEHPHTKLTKTISARIDDAAETIDISTAYFGPTAAIRRSLQQAAKRGVAIRILCNGPYSSHPNAMQAGRHHYQSLLKAGISLYEYQPTKTHSKIIVIDRKLTVIGSVNLNSRSFRHDEEVAVMVKDPSMATNLTQAFEADLKSSRKIDLAAWRKRPITQKLHQVIASVGRYFF